MRINAPHGIPKVTTATGISGSMETTKTPSTIFLVREVERPRNSVNLTRPIPADVEIKAKPPVRNTTSSSSSLKEGWNAITPSVTTKMIAQPVMIRSRTLVLMAVQAIRPLQNRQHESSFELRPGSAEPRTWAFDARSLQ